MHQAGALNVLRRFVAQHRTQRAAAKALGISEPYLTDLLKGHRGLSNMILAGLGLAREVTIVAKKG